MSNIGPTKVERKSIEHRTKVKWMSNTGPTKVERKSNERRMERQDNKMIGRRTTRCRATIERKFDENQMEVCGRQFVGGNGCRPTLHGSK